MKFYLLYGSKFVLGRAIIPYQENKFMKKGNEYHDLMEQAAMSIKSGYSAPITTHRYWKEWWGQWLESIYKKWPHMLVEDKIGIDSDLRGWALDEWWRPANKSLFGNRILRYQGKLDLIAFDKSSFDNPTFAMIPDWKSGKTRVPERFGQLGFYAFLAMCFWPSLQKVTTMNVFLDEPFGVVLDQVDKYWTIKYTREADFKSLSEKYFYDTEKIYQDLKVNKWGCTQHMCKWCPATKEHCGYAKQN
jgi:hypothetical protein